MAKIRDWDFGDLQSPSEFGLVKNTREGLGENTLGRHSEGLPF